MTQKLLHLGLILSPGVGVGGCSGPPTQPELIRLGRPGALQAQGLPKLAVAATSLGTIQRKTNPSHHGN